MIAIKGMEMPTSCKECMLNNVDSPWFGLCRTTGNNVIEYKDSRHRDCPLVEIVTCKDCKYNVKNGKNTTMCDLGHRFYMRDHNTFYCADGTREEEPRDYDDTFVNGLPRGKKYFEERITGNPDFCNG